PVTNPVGAGPYRLKSFIPGQRSLYTRFEHYYKPNRPYADELEIIEFKDQVSRAAALRAGQIDVASGVQAEHSALLK
ncbi:ABC transporter substrate-binding protein, partial [Pseudomonas sp. SIMBA_068]